MPKNQLIIALGCNCTMQIPTSKSFRTFNLSLSRRNDKKNPKTLKFRTKILAQILTHLKFELDASQCHDIRASAAACDGFQRKLMWKSTMRKPTSGEHYCEILFFSSVECGNVHWSSNHLQLSICGREGREGVFSPMDDSTRAPRIPTLA